MRYSNIILTQIIPRFIELIKLKFPVASSTILVSSQLQLPPLRIHPFLILSNSPPTPSFSRQITLEPVLERISRFPFRSIRNGATFREFPLPSSLVRPSESLETKTIGRVTRACADPNTLFSLTRSTSWFDGVDDYGGKRIARFHPCPLFSELVCACILPRY